MAEVRTSGTQYVVPDGVYAIKVWPIGGGGAGGGANTEGQAGDGGGAGGIAYAVLPVTPGDIINYSLGAAGIGAAGGNGTSGGDTSVTVGATTVIGNGGTRGATNGAAIGDKAGGSFSGGDGGANGGNGHAVSGDVGGGQGGAVGGGGGSYPGGGAGGNGGQSVDIQELFNTLASIGGYPTVSPGTGADNGSSPANGKNGGSATGFGCGGGGAGWYGGTGGNGLYGGGGGGAAGRDGTAKAGGNGGQGVVVFDPIYAGGMDTNIIGLSTTGLTASTNRFLGPYTMGGAWVTTAIAAAGQEVMPINGILRNLYVKMAAADATFSRTFTVYRNGVATSLSVTLAAGVTSGSDLNQAHNVPFAKGDVISLVTSAGGTTVSTGIISWSLAASTAANTSMILSSSGAAIGTTLPVYIAPQGTNFDATAIGNAEVVCPTDGTIRNAYAVLNTAIAGGTNYTFTLYKNGSPTSLAITINTATTKGYDLTNSVSVAAGDRLCWVASTSAVPASKMVFISAEFDPTYNGESIHMFGGATAQTNSAVRYQTLAEGGNTYNTTEANRQAISQPAAWKKLFVYEQTSIATGSWAYIPMIQGAAHGPTVTISSGQTGNDTSTIYSCNGGDSISMRITPTSTPTGSVVEWGIVSAMAVAYSAAPSDSATASDASSKQVGKPASDSATTSEAAVKSVGKASVDSVTTSEAAVKSVGKFISDSSVPTDSVSKSSAKSVSDSASASDQAAKQIGKEASDSASTNDAVNKAVAKSAADSIAPSDESMKQVTKAVSDTSTAIDSVGKAFGKRVSDGVSTSDSVFKAIGKFISDVVTAIENAVTTFVASTPAGSRKKTTLGQNDRSSLPGQVPSISLLSQERSKASGIRQKQGGVILSQNRK